MREKHNTREFDFDHWSSVARENPDRFESMRAALLEQMIEQSPEDIKRRMLGLQWRIDQVRNRSANPLAACLRISRMMWNSVLGDHGLLTALETPEKILRAGKLDREHKVVHLNRSEDPGKS
ncbi:MAG: DUF3135 domain-containing protein [Gammaproteobacteria bacterium]